VFYANDDLRFASIVPQENKRLNIFTYNNNGSTLLRRTYFLPLPKALPRFDG
jgi:hypothetical protein